MGRMTRTIWVTWVMFLVGQVGLIHKLIIYKLSGCDPDITCSLENSQCWHLVNAWVNLRPDECTEAYCLKLFWSCGVQNFVFKKSVQRTSSVSCQEWRNLWHCSISTICIIFKLQHVCHKWVMILICGSHPDCSASQWVKWVNRCDPLSTLMQIHMYSKTNLNLEGYRYVFILHYLHILGTPFSDHLEICTTFAISAVTIVTINIWSLIRSLHNVHSYYTQLYIDIGSYI